MKLILASQSPRRRELLARMGLDFTVISPRIDEDSFSDPDPAALVRTLSREKALAVAKEQESDTLVIAADTVVVLDGQTGFVVPAGDDGALRDAVVRFVIGEEDIDAGWENFQNTMKNMQAEKYTQVYTDAYNRYMGN